jgi:TPR repeat protein
VSTKSGRTHNITSPRALASDLALLGVVSIGTALAAVGLMQVRGVLTPTARFFVPALLTLLGPLGIGATAFAGAVALRAHARRMGAASTTPYPAMIRSIVVAVGILVPLSLVPLALFLWRAVDLTQPALFDKRSLVAFYYLMVLGVPIALLAGARATAATRTDPTGNPCDTPGLGGDAAAPWRRLRPTLALIAAAVMASYFYGPPWGGRPLGGPIDSHEIVHFTGLQAIHVGRIPYVGAGSEQYGPGSQLFVFGWMKFVGGFTVQGFREAYAALHWLGVAFVCAVVLLFLPTRAAVIALALALLVFPTFQQFGFHAASYDGFWGWGNVWRYAGEVLLGLALPHALLESGGTSRWRLAVFGAVWGVTCLLGQENMAGGIFIIGAVGLALVLSGSLTCAPAGRSLLALGAGAAVVMVPVLAIYLSLGQAGPFLRNFFWMIRTVGAGEWNTMWSEAQPTWWHTTFLLLPVLTLACGVIAVLRRRPLTIAGPWSQGRAALFGCFVAAAVVQSGALLRSDVSHLVGVMLVTPLLVGATAALGGALLELRSAIGRSVFGLCVIAAGWALLPWESASFTAARARLSNPWSVRTAPYPPREEPRPRPGGTAARLGPGYEEWPTSGYADSDGTRIIQPISQNIRLADDLRRVVGGRTTYVSRDAPDGDGQQGLWYFLADLHPFDLPFEPRGMAHFNRVAQAENLRALADRGRHLDAVVTLKPASEDSRIAIERLGPTPVVYLLPYGTTSGNNRRSRENDFIVKVYEARWATDSAAGAAMRVKATEGDAAAQSNLGVMYEYGHGVPQDAAQAMAWYRKAADQGDASAQYALGATYGTGKGAPLDDAQAVAWYRKAADQGLAVAQFNLGLMYERGQGISKNDAQAVTWYRKAAVQGVADAQSNLGVMYRDGRGVPQDYEQAKNWLLRAAVQGLAIAQFNAGVMYAKGQFFRQNDAVAMDLYLKAANQGLAVAQFNLGLMHDHGQGVPKDDAQAVTWYRRAADQGDANAQFSLGAKYASGQGVPRDDTEAHKWRLLAAARASAEDQKQYADTRDAVAKTMTPKQLAGAQRRASEWTAAFEKRTK